MPANVSSEYVSQALCQTLQTTKINFEKLLGQQVFNTHNFNPFQSTSSLTISFSLCICYVIYSIFLLVFVLLNLVAVPIV